MPFSRLHFNQKNLEQKFICELIEAASILLHQNNNILNITSVINDAHVRRIKLILEDAKQKGGEVIELLKPNQFEKLETKQMIPSVILNSNQDMIALNEEIFGPILPLVYYGNLNDAINFINDRPSPLEYTGLVQTKMKQIKL